MSAAIIVSSSMLCQDEDNSSSDGETITKLCRQVSIESPGALFKDCVFSFIVPIPDTPSTGARIKVVCAGACYQRNRSTSVSSVSSGCSIEQHSDIQHQQHQQLSPAHHGIRNGSLFPGFEVAGIIEALGTDIKSTANFFIGQRVVLYPFNDAPAGYADYIVVPEIKYLIPIPDTLPLSVAAMLPTGALLAMNTVFQAHKIVTKVFKQQQQSQQDDDTIKKCKILIVGTGGLALWAVRIAAHYFSLSDNDDGMNSSRNQQNVQITVASLRDEGLMLAKGENVNVVQWSEDLYEKQLIERTTDACEGFVDVVIDFGSTSRSLHRSLQCLTKGGVVLISESTAEKLLPKFTKRAEERQQQIQAVANGTIEQLRELVELVASHKIEAPPHSVFPCEEASDVVRKLCNSEIPGRAILQFHEIE